MRRANLDACEWRDDQRFRRGSRVGQHALRRVRQQQWRLSFHRQRRELGRLQFRTGGRLWRGDHAGRPLPNLHRPHPAWWSERLLEQRRGQPGFLQRQQRRQLDPGVLSVPHSGQQSRRGLDHRLRGSGRRGVLLRYAVVWSVEEHGQRSDLEPQRHRTADRSFIQLQIYQRSGQVRQRAARDGSDLGRVSQC